MRVICLAGLQASSFELYVEGLVLRDNVYFYLASNLMVAVGA